MGPAWVLSAPDGPHVGPMNLAIKDASSWNSRYTSSLVGTVNIVHFNYLVSAREVHHQINGLVQKRCNSSAWAMSLIFLAIIHWDYVMFAESTQGYWLAAQLPWHLHSWSWVSRIERTPGPWFNIKMSSYQHRKSHCGDKTVVRSSYLHNGISYTGKMSSLYWIMTLLSYYLCRLCVGK